jgi:hypothetical protein
MDVDTPSNSGRIEVPVDALLIAPSSSISAVNIENLRLRSSAQAFYGNSMISKLRLRTSTDGKKIDRV